MTELESEDLVALLICDRIERVESRMMLRFHGGLDCAGVATREWSEQSQDGRDKGESQRQGRDVGKGTTKDSLCCG